MHQFSERKQIYVHQAQNDDFFLLGPLAFVFLDPEFALLVFPIPAVVVVIVLDPIQTTYNKVHKWNIKRRKRISRKRSWGIQTYAWWRW